jgi:hypothetical protein
MAWTSGEYIAEDLLETTTDSTSTQYVEDLYITSSTSTTPKRIKRIYANDENNEVTIVWDIQNYYLESYDFDISSSGGSVKNYIEVESYSEDIEGYTHNLGYTVSPTTIAKTTSEYDTEHRIKVTQNGSYDYVYVYATQAGRVEVSRSYGIPSVENTYIDTAPAKGGVIYLSVYWKQSVTIVYDNGTTEDGGYDYGKSDATVLTLGNKVVTGCSIDDGGVYVPSAGSLVDSTAQKYCCNITKYSFEANGVTATKSGATIPIYREKNTVTYEYYVWVGTPSPSTIDGAGGVFYVDAECSERKVFTSGHETSWGSSSANVSYANGASGVTSFSGTKEITVSVMENTDDIRYPKVTVTASGDSSIYETVQVTQNAVEWVFTAGNTMVEVDYNTTSVTLTGTSSRNGFYQEISKSNVSVSGGTVGIVTSSGTTFNIPISFASNSSVTSKTITVTVTQPLSGNKLTYTIVQAAKPAEIDWIQWRDSRGVWSPSTSGRFEFSAALLYKKELHGKGTIVRIIPMKGSTEIASATEVTLNGTLYNADMYVQNISIIVRTTNDGSPFYLKAIYGNDTETIQLDSDLT